VVEQQEQGPSLISTQRRLFVEGAGLRCRAILLASNVGHWSGPLKPRVGVSCFRRLIIFKRWPRRKPYSRAEKPPIAFICELKKQGRIGPVLRGEGQFAISDCASAAQWHLKSQRNKSRIKCWEKGLVPSRLASRLGAQEFSSSCVNPDT